MALWQTSKGGSSDVVFLQTEACPRSIHTHVPPTTWSVFLVCYEKRWAGLFVEERKVCVEACLPRVYEKNQPPAFFFNFTSAHGRFYEAPRPSFSEPPPREPSVPRPHRREMLAGQAPGLYYFHNINFALSNPSCL